MACLRSLLQDCPVAQENTVRTFGVKQASGCAPDSIKEVHSGVIPQANPLQLLDHFHSTVGAMRKIYYPDYIE